MGIIDTDKSAFPDYPRSDFLTIELKLIEAI
jgi:hypothetical protein